MLRNLFQLGRFNGRRIFQLVVVLLAATALKFFYSTASVNELRWVLAPTTLAVELITGQRFLFESYAGYINQNHTFVIAASCAGVNFLLTAFLMLALRRLWTHRSQEIKWTFFCVAALVAYIATVITNAIRITIAMQLREMRIGSSWLSAGQVHRLEGIFVYFGFLLLLYVLSERLSNRKSVSDGQASRVRSVSGLDHLKVFRQAFFPLLIYYATTLALPLANGAYREANFWQHSIFVLVVPLVLIIPFIMFCCWKRLTSRNNPAVSYFRGPR